jgi:hypothetical protein
MGMGGSVGVVLITTALGGVAAVVVANLLIVWLQISNFEGGAGYFTLFVTLVGIVGGFITGLIAALAVRSDFWKAQSYAAGAILVLAILGAVLPVVFDDKGPKLDGENLALQVELKNPPGWKPDRSRAGQVHGNFCWLQQYAADAPNEQNRIRTGGMRLGERDGSWVASGSFDLEETRSHRYVRIFLGKTTDVSIDVPLPRHPSAKFKAWSDWATSGFYAQKDTPVPPGFTWRYRVQTVAEDRREHPEPQARLDEYRKRLEGLRREDPLAKWLPLFEGPDGEPQQPSNSEATQSLLREKSGELPALLRSTDANVRRAAIFAAAYYYPKIPDSLIEPVAAAGEHTVDLIREAAGADPNEPDLAAEDRAYTYFLYWHIAMGNAGEPADRVCRPVLEKIERAALEGPKEGKINDIAKSAREHLDKIGAAK